MEKLFLATTFSGHVDYETGRVQEDFRQFIESIIDSLREKGLEVFCAVEHEGWVIKDELPEIGVAKDLDEIDASDLILAIVHPEPSAGLQFEIGYAVANNKRVVLATNESEKLAYFNEGIINLGKVSLIRYAQPEDIAEILTT